MTPPTYYLLLCVLQRNGIPTVIIFGRGGGQPNCGTLALRLAHHLPSEPKFMQKWRLRHTCFKLSCAGGAVLPAQYLPLSAQPQPVLPHKRARQTDSLCQ